jgi:hypothetical protein
MKGVGCTKEANPDERSSGPVIKDGVENCVGKSSRQHEEE